MVKCYRCTKRVKKSFQCELCYEVFCWDCCGMDDQGSDERVFCIECQDFCFEQGIFSVEDESE